MTTKLALLGGEAVGSPEKKKYPVFEAEVISEIVGLLNEGQTVGLGRAHPVIAKAEQAISSYHGERHALALNSGQASLMCALMGLEIGPRDEVITTPYTWGASTSCILAVGAIPIFVDVDPATGLMDPDKIEPAISPRTKAILVVHLYGQPAPMAAINEVAHKHGLFVIEDGSQAHGARIDGQVVGNFGDAAGFSCMGGKLLATAEAGYMVTANEDVFWKAAMMCQHYGRSGEAEFPQKFKAYADSLVFTFRLSPLIACMFPSQVAKLDGEVAGRQENVAMFRQAMANCEVVEFPNYPAGHQPAYHMLTMNFDAKKAGVRRDTFLKALNAEGVKAFAYVPAPIHKWRRLQWENYQGPVPFWLANLSVSEINYAELPLPNSDYKVEHAIELGWNEFYEPDPESMQRLAAAFLKVQDNLAALQAYERELETQETTDTDQIIGAAKRAAAAYRPTRK
jgi:dTDP-4-amino-4,6-dideoxygalactose transaminase